MQSMCPKIKKIYVAFPKNTRTYEEDMSHLDAKKLKIAKENIGVSKRYITDESTYASDLCIAALKEALKGDEDIEAMIVVSLTPDYLVPKLSSIISNKLNLNHNILLIDMIAYCSGFITALFQASLLLEHYKKVAVVCVDTQSKKQDFNDKMSISITSDSASVMIVEPSNEKMYFNEEGHLSHIFEMSSLYGIMKKADTLLTTNHNSVFKEFFKHFTPFYKNFQKNTPQVELNIFHTPSVFFKKCVEKECKIEIFNKSLTDFACAFINDIPLNLILANNESIFTKKKRIMLASHGTGMTINAANISIEDFEGKIIFI